MKGVVLPIPPAWSQPDRARTHYILAPDLTLDVSNVEGTPEDPPAWIAFEISRRLGAPATTAITPSISRTTTQTGWPAFIAEASHAGLKIQLVMYQLLELAAVCTLLGPTAAFDGHVAAVTDVLMQPRVHWGDPPLTLADLLAGVPDA